MNFNDQYNNSKKDQSQESIKRGGAMDYACASRLRHNASVEETPDIAAVNRNNKSSPPNIRPQIEIRRKATINDRHSRPT